MKVTISYQVDFEEVPDSVSQLIKNLSENDYPSIAKHFLNIRNHLGNEQYTTAVESIDLARQELAKLDQKLLDYSNIVVGYAKADADLKSGMTADELFMPPNPQTQEVSAENILDEKKEND
jgi:hypothetical protein